MIENALSNKHPPPNLNHWQQTHKHATSMQVRSGSTVFMGTRTFVLGAWYLRDELGLDYMSARGRDRAGAPSKISGVRHEARFEIEGVALVRKSKC